MMLRRGIAATKITSGQSWSKEIDKITNFLDGKLGITLLRFALEGIFTSRNENKGMFPQPCFCLCLAYSSFMAYLTDGFQI